MRTLDPVLREGLERANPVTCDIIEVSAPDATQILRRANDQFFSTPPRVSETPGASSAADANGALILAPTNFELASFYNTTLGGEANILDPDVSHSIKGAGWTIDPAFGRGILKKFTARIRRTETTAIDLQLQIYRPKLQRMFYRDMAGAVVETSQVTFLQVLPQPVVTRYAGLVWTANFADVVFDLSQVRPEVGPGPILGDPLGSALAQNPPYVFVISTVTPPKKGVFRWMLDEITANDVASIGRFQEMEFGRPKPEDRWTGGVAVNDYIEAFKLEIERYAATSQIVYAITLPSEPVAASVGRIVFDRATPPGTAAVLELSTAGAGGPWTTVKHGDVVAAKQLDYHLRLTMTPPASIRLTPRIAALGIDFRIPVDVSAEVIMDPLAHEISLPYCASGVGEGRATIVRAGRRDYRDIASDLAINYPTSKLELDHYIGSRHPRITRDRWFHMDRAPVTNRDPTETGETFSLLSPLKALKRKVPAKVETINKVHTVVVGTTAAQVIVTPALDGAAVTGDYLGQGYYMRVRTSATVGVEAGAIHTINNNTNTDRLDFLPNLPWTLVAGDIVEVHSAQFTQPVVEWTDADPADVWWEVFTDLLGIAPEKIGLGGVGQASRSGLPPLVTDRAPGDATTQAKLTVTLRLKPEEDADKLVDQLSFLMGGCTVDIGGQYVFRQIYPLRDANNQITVPTAAPAKAFDQRDYAGLQTPVGLEQRITQLSCDYGVNTTLVSDETQSASTVVFVDADAIAYLAPQDVEGLGRGTIAKEISRWLYNSADQGRFFAEQLAQQVVNVASTGLRIWSFTAVDSHPELHVGDAVWIVTDQYTDYDPTRKIDIRGSWAFAVIIVSVQAAGRRFRVLVPGLTASAGIPVRGGGGTIEVLPIPVSPEAPTALITPVLALRTRPQEILQFDGALGAGDPGPLTWRYQVEDVWSAPSVLPLPQTVAITREQFYGKNVALEVTQGDGQIALASFAVAPNHTALDAVNGIIIRTEPYTDGDYAVPSTTSAGLDIRDTVRESGGKQVRRMFAKPMPGDADDADSVNDGLTRRAVPSSVLRFADGALLTKVDRGATIGEQSAERLIRGARGIFYHEAFDALPPNCSVAPSGGATLSLDQTIGSAKVGRNVLRVQNLGEFLGHDWLPFNPTKLYRFRARFRSVVNDSINGANLLYIGILQRRADGTPANSNSGAFYCVVPGSLFSVAMGWQEVTTWVKGATVAFGTAGGPATDARTPSAANVDTVEITPYVIVNYTGGGADGTTDLDYLQIEELDEDAAERIYETVQSDAATLYGTVRESGGKLANRLFAKPLAADPDSLDSAADGTTYKKVLGVTSGLITPSSSTGRNRCKVSHNAHQSVADDSFLVLAFNLENYDTGSLHDTATNNSRITVPAGGNTGVWVLTATLSWDANANGRRGVAIRKNSLTIMALVDQASNGDAATPTWIQCIAMDDAPSVGDYYEVVASQASGGALLVLSGVSTFTAVHLW